MGGKGGGVDPGNDYPPRWRYRPQDSRLDQWREYNRECTSFVAWALHSRNGFEMPFFQNANRWGPMATRRGFVVNSNPSIGSVAWSNAGLYGHVAYVVAVNHGTVTVEEYNFMHRGAYDKRVVADQDFTGFIHFKDLLPERTPVAAPAAALLAETYPETTGGSAATWSNYATAEGSQGPPIRSNATVEISCALTGFRVQDGNTWWYRIASSPWSNSYYVSADAFYNDGATSGTLIGTPFVDPSVRTC